jgi:hypothetical protein
MFSIFLFITANFYVFSYSDVEEMEHYAGVPLPTLYSGDRDQSKMGELIVIWQSAISTTRVSILILSITPIACKE